MSTQEVTTKSFAHTLRLDSLGSTPLSEELVLQLVETLLRLARSRLTDKQLSLLVESRKVLSFYPLKSYSALADILSRKLKMPLSTVKFNLRVLREAGLLEMKRKLQGRKWRNTVILSEGGQLLAQSLEECDNVLK